MVLGLFDPGSYELLLHGQLLVGIEATVPSSVLIMSMMVPSWPLVNPSDVSILWMRITLQLTLTLRLSTKEEVPTVPSFLHNLGL